MASCELTMADGVGSDLDSSADSAEFLPLASDELRASVDVVNVNGGGDKLRDDESSCCWRCAAAAALAVLACGALLLIGRAVELHEVAQTPSTDQLYSSNWVCARDEKGNIRSVSNHSMLETSGGTLSAVHCAKCGACSSETDMAIYRATRLNITEIAASVALGVFFGPGVFSESLRGKDCSYHEGSLGP